MRCLVSGLLVTQLAFTSTAFADDTVSDTLRESTEVSFVDTPLEEVLDFLSDLHNVPIELDEAAIAKAGLKTDVPVTLELSGVPMESALNLALSQGGLTLRVEEAEILVIPAPKPTKPDEKPPAPRLRSLGAERIGVALQDATRFEFVKTPLHEALSFCGDLHNITIVLDERGLRESRIRTDAPVTVRIREDTTFREALRAMLDPLDLQAFVWSDVLYVTPKPDAKELQRRLDGAAEILVIDRTLAEILEELHERHRVPIALDGPAIAKAGLKTDRRVNRFLSRVSLRTMLVLLAEQEGLACRFENGGVIIIPQPAGEREAEVVAPDSPAAARVKRIEAALNEKTDVEFREPTPLREALEYYSSLHAIPVFLDERGMRERKLDTSTRVSIRTKDATLGQALKTILDPLGLEAVIRHEVLFVTPKPAETKPDAPHRAEP